MAVDLVGGLIVKGQTLDILSARSRFDWRVPPIRGSPGGTGRVVRVRVWRGATIGVMCGMRRGEGGGLAGEWARMADGCSY